MKEEINHIYLAEIELINIRCFKEIVINIEKEDKPSLWTMILGDNSAGKTTLLRCLALGICNAADASFLLKKMDGELLREGENKGIIKVRLKQEKINKDFTISTVIEKPSKTSPLVLNQTTKPVNDFPWNDIFICGYGVQRSALAPASAKEYQAKWAVSTLFDYNANLQNPEVVLLRQDQEVRDKTEKKVLEILMLDPDKYGIELTKQGLLFRSPWGILPFDSLSDGYRSTIRWTLDFVSWLIFVDRYSDEDYIGGILLIDELEQHLHPRWQRYIVQQLRKQFPKIQFITTTHTPLVASGIVDIKDSVLLKLNETEPNKVSSQFINKELLKGKRADQILASSAFDLITSRSPRSTDMLLRYAELHAKSRSQEEENEFIRLSGEIKGSLVFGENEFEQLVEKAVSETLDKLLAKPAGEILDLETKKQLRNLFRKEE